MIQYRDALGVCAVLKVATSVCVCVLLCIVLEAKSLTNTGGTLRGAEILQGFSVCQCYHVRQMRL